MHGALTMLSPARSATRTAAFSSSTAINCRSRLSLVGCKRRAVAVAATARESSEANLQLATARLPPSADADVFADSLYQWASTMTQSGANFPFALPLLADKLPAGFQISLLKRSKAGSFGSAGDIVGTVEDAAGVGKVLVVRFFEGPTAQEGRSTPPPSDSTERLELVLKSLVDVDTIMSTMPGAIRAAAAAATQT